MRRLPLKRLLLSVVGLAIFGGAVAGGVFVLDRVFGPVQVAVATPSAVPMPSPSMVAVSEIMNGIKGDCTACHLDPDGGVGTKPIPPVGHPVQGWEDCTNCHAPTALAGTAPGHTGIHANQCLVCHTSESAPAPMRPHGSQNTACLSCHGVTAPLPASMQGRKESTCWLCHQETTETPPLIPHPLAGNAACLSCHTAGKIGALPANHQGRTEAVCTQCHAASGNNAPTAPHSLAGLEGKCGQCHAAGTSGTPGGTGSPAPPGSAAPNGSPVPNGTPAPSGSRYPLVTPGPTAGGSTAP